MNKLVWCDAALIYYAKGNDSWFWTKFRDLDRANGLGRPKTKNWLTKTIYVGPPQTDPKDFLLIQDALVIRNYEPFKPEVLQPFVEELGKSS